MVARNDVLNFCLSGDLFGFSSLEEKFFVNDLQ